MFLSLNAAEKSEDPRPPQSADVDLRIKSAAFAPPLNAPPISALLRRRTRQGAPPIASTSFPTLALRERFDIQAWLLGTPALLGEDLLVVATEFDRFDSSFQALDDKPRMVLAPEEYPPEITASVSGFDRTKSISDASA